MKSRADIETAIRSLYAARINGDIEASLKDFAEDASFTLNGKGVGQPGLGEPCVGKPALRNTLRGLVETYRFDDWKEVDLLVDGQTASLSWQARITCMPTGKSEVFDGVDIVSFKDGKITSFRQSTDTAMVMKISS